MILTVVCDREATISIQGFPSAQNWRARVIVGEGATALTLSSISRESRDVALRDATNNAAETLEKMAAEARKLGEQS